MKMLPPVAGNGEATVQLVITSTVYHPVSHGRDARATMASWHGRPGHDRKLDRFVNFVSTKLVSGAKLAPQGRLRKAQGASPGNKDSNNGSPEGAMQWVPVPKTCLMTSIYLELRPNSLPPFQGFPQSGP